MNNHQNGSARLGMTRRHQQGFTLVEIGVVLLIIGLLLGAVLKGQELIASARVNNLISSMNGYKAAIYAFQDRYRMMPGDSSAAATKVGTGAVNCTVSCDDGLISYMHNASLVNNHLSAAGFYSGPAGTVESNDGPGPATFLNNPGGGPIFVANMGFVDNSHNNSVGTGLPLVLQTGGRLSSKLLAEVDRRIDNGTAESGRFQVSTEPWQTSGWTGCVTGADGWSTRYWIEDNPGKNCGGAEILEGYSP